MRARFVAHTSGLVIYPCALAATACVPSRLPRLVDRGTSFRKRWPSPPPFEESPGTSTLSDPLALARSWPRAERFSTVHDCCVSLNVARARTGVSSRSRVPRVRRRARDLVARGVRLISLIRETLGRAHSEERGGCVSARARQRITSGPIE